MGWQSADLAQQDWTGFQESWGKNSWGRLFGCGAGLDTDGIFYDQEIHHPGAREHLRNPGDKKNHYMASAAIMAGFLDSAPIKNEINRDLQWMYNNDIAYTKHFRDGSTAKVLWQYSLLKPEWRSDWISAVDFGSMMFGYALNYLPEGFYQTYAA